MKDSESISRVIFCRLGGIGDVIHTLPFVKLLKNKYKIARVEYITSENIAQLLRKYCPYIDRVWIFDKKNKAKLSKEIKLEGVRVDCFFNLHNSLSFFFYNLFFIQAKKFLQYKKNKNMHAVVNFAKTFDESLSAFELEAKVLEDECFEDDVNSLDQNGLKVGSYICLVPGVGKIRLNRSWPIQNWSLLTTKLLALNRQIKIVFLGGEDERILSEKLPSIADRTVNLIGKLDLVDTVKVISKSKLLVSGDTGLLHIATGLLKNVVGLYGPTEVERTGPFFSNSQVLVASNCQCKSLKKCSKTSNSSGYCMSDLSVEAVLDKLNLSFSLVNL